MSTQTQNSDVRVDVIVNSLKELQQERSGLELKLNELRRKRYFVEKNVEGLTGKYLQVREINAKLSDTLQVAQQKVTHTQQTIDALQKKCEIASAENQRLSDEAERYKTSQLDVMKEYENEIVGMIDKFKDAQTFYKVDNLKKEISECGRMAQEFETASIEKAQQAQGLCEDFQRITLKAQANDTLTKNLDILPEMQDMVLQILACCRNSLEGLCNQQDSANDKLKEENHQLESKISEMETV